MVCSYLRKKKLYNLACLLFPDIAFPKMIKVSYSSGCGQESIEFGMEKDGELLFVRVGCLPRRKWFHLTVTNEDGILRDSVRVLSDFDNPVITYPLPV